MKVREEEAGGKLKSEREIRWSNVDSKTSKGWESVDVLRQSLCGTSLADGRLAWLMSLDKAKYHILLSSTV